MTLRLYFLRHGKAWSRADWLEEDERRPLTDAGEALVHAEGRAMKAMGLAPDVIVTSPLVRARRTAEIVAEELGASARLVEDSRLAHGFDAGRLARIVEEHGVAASLLVVGHEPDFSATVAELTGGGRVDFKKGGLARVDVSGPELYDGILAWLLTPALITGE